MCDYIEYGAGVRASETAATAVVRTGNITKNDRIRERELFRFYRPKGVQIESSANTPLSGAPITDPEATPPISDKDVTLGVFAQLVAHRLEVHRAMINVIGRETQYTLVESTKTLDLQNQTTSDVQGDESWVGSGGFMHKQVSICETVVQLPSDGSKGSFLIIPDLRLDPRFKTRSYVTGAPYYRFYAGTPLKTAQGVVIGALCAFAREPREDLTSAQKSFMVTIAEQIMQHLEMKRAAVERDKATTMSKALAAFVEGSTNQFAARTERQTFRNSFGSPLSEQGKDSDAPDGKIAKFNLNEQAESTVNLEVQPTTMTSVPGSYLDEESMPSKDDKATISDTIPDVDTKSESETEIEVGMEPWNNEPSSKVSESPDLEQQIKSTLTRAASLLVEALRLSNGSGVVFYDTVSPIDRPSAGGSVSASPMDSRDDWGNFSDGAITPGVLDGVIDSEEARAPVLGEKVTASLDGQPSDQHYRELTSRELSKLIRRYPSGQLWEFDEHGVIPAADVPGRASMTAEREARQEAEGVSFANLYVRARSLIFLPLWDANLGRYYSGCFVWSTDAMGRFSTEGDLSFLTAFGNSISAEISRLITLDADQRKSDFISSISHEFRSPLHAIVGAASYLSDLDLNPDQLSTAQAIDASASTLLDTINHVLDFSKISSLRRTWKTSSDTVQTPMAGKMPDKITFSNVTSIMGSTDIAAICEEVIHSVYTGKMYSKAVSEPDRVSVTDAQERGAEPATGHHSRASSGHVKPRVHLLLDISPGDYHFIAQPGAVRCIIMNIFGNALKYTEHGSVIVRLFQQGHDDCNGGEHRCKVVLIVKDTGCGISNSYMRTRLYTPFAQEDDNAPGTGLGLSIVRTILTLLRGDISIRSQKGHGTEVRVVLQHMQRPHQALRPGEMEPERTTLKDFEYLETLPKRMRVGLYGFDSGEELSKEKENILRQYLQEFCHAVCVTDWRRGPIPDAIVVHERHLPALERDASVNQSTDIIVLRNNPLPSKQRSDASLGNRHLLLEPFGPHKLARALRRCAEKSSLPLSCNPAAFSDQQADPEPSLSGVLARASRPRLPTINTQPPASTLASPGAALVRPGSEAGPSAAAGARRYPAILVVDDSEVNRRLLERYCSKRLVVKEVDLAEDGLVAVAMAKAKAYDIIFMDINMPKMDGIEATREIRKYEEGLRSQQGRVPEQLSYSGSHGNQPAGTIAPGKAPGHLLLPPLPSATYGASTTTASGLQYNIGPYPQATPPVSPDEREVRFDTDESRPSTSVPPAQRAKIIAFSAQDNDTVFQQGLEAGIDEWIVKPCGMSESRGPQGKYDEWMAKYGGTGSSVPK